jgi:hypothetical protein
MDKVLNAVQVVVGSFLLLIIVEYGLDIKKPYPRWVIEIYDEPIVRFVSCVVIFILACWSPVLAILVAVMIVFLHIDHINLAKKQAYFSLDNK